MVAPSPLHRFGGRDQAFFVWVFRCGESVQMADGALGDHGFDVAGERARERGGQVHGEAGGILDHLCVNYLPFQISKYNRGNGGNGLKAWLWAIPST